MTKTPNREAARGMYRQLAGTYDQRVRAAAGVRREAVRLLDLIPGDVILDVGCGTGLSFPLLEAGVGPAGKLIGLDLSAEMLAKASERAKAAGWENITLIESAIEEAEIPTQADAVLFHFVHDISRSRAAIENVFHHVKPSGRVAAAGGKWAQWWAVPVNIVMWRISRRYVTTFEGFDRPWTHTAEYVPDLRVKTAMFGGAYIAWGTRR